MAEPSEPKTAPTKTTAPPGGGPTTTAALAATSAEPPTEPARRKEGKVRRISAAVLLVLTFILTPIAVTVGYANVLVHSEDTYAEAVVPLATDPDVIAALEDRAVAALMDQVDELNLDTQVDGWLGGTKLPEFVQNAILAALGSLRDTLEGSIERAVHGFLTSDEFPQMWETINRIAFRQGIGILDGTSALTDDAGGLTLELNPILIGVRERLVENGHEWATRIPISDLTYSYPLATADETAELRNYHTLAIRLMWVVLIIAAVVLVASCLLPRDRWRGLLRTAVAALLGLVALAVALRLVVAQLVSEATGELQSPAARQAVANILLAGLRDWLQVAAVVAVVAVIVGWLGGRFASGTGIPGESALAWLRDPRYLSVRRVTMAVAGGLLVALLLFADLSTGWTILIGLLLLVAVVLALIPAREAEEPPTDPPAPPTEFEVAGTATG